MHPSKSQLKRIYSSLRRKPNVVACFLGFKYSNGRRRKSIAIVCLVRKKARRLAARSRVPAHITWRASDGRRYEIPTDIVVVRAAGTMCASTCEPGDGAQALETGSIGMAISHPLFGNVVTTAGHCALGADEPAGTYDFSKAPRPATLLNLASGTSQPGGVLRAACTVLSDYALIRPESPGGCTNIYRSGTAVQAPPASDPALGSQVTLLTATGDSKSAYVIGLHAEMPIGKAGRMYQTILTTPILVGGDSGGVLITAANEALGLAVGFVPVDQRRVISVFMSAAFLLQREAATFI